MRGLHPQSHLTLRYCVQATNKKRCTSTFIMSMDPKLDPKQCANLEWDDPIHKVTWHLDIMVMWRIEHVISPFWQGLWTPNLSRCWLRMRETHSQSHVTRRRRGHVRNQRRYISTFTRPMDPKLRSIVT